MRTHSIQSTLLGRISVLKKGQNKHGHPLEPVFGINSKHENEGE